MLITRLGILKFTLLNSMVPSLSGTITLFTSKYRLLELY